MILWPQVSLIEKINRKLPLQYTGTSHDGRHQYGYLKPSYGKVTPDVNTTVSGKNNTYDVSTETPYGFTGTMGGILRADRISIFCAKNHQVFPER